MWMCSICGYQAASWTSGCRKLQWILIIGLQASRVAESVGPCWRALCLCSITFAHRALMAGTVHLQWLDNTLLKEQLLLCSPDLAETSLWQPAQCRGLKCHSFFFLFLFYCDSFFMIMACGGEIIDVKRGRALALIQVRHRLRFSFPKKKKIGKQKAKVELKKDDSVLFLLLWDTQHGAMSR